VSDRPSPRSPMVEIGTYRTRSDAARHNTSCRSWAEPAVLEVMLSADDYDTELAERYGWINRALPANTLDQFVGTLAHRIAAFPAARHVAVKGVSTRSRSRPLTTSAAIQISSARVSRERTLEARTRRPRKACKLTTGFTSRQQTIDSDGRVSAFGDNASCSFAGTYSNPRAPG
jgi:hypothetical protein